jgi:hypothetical protein
MLIFPILFLLKYIANLTSEKKMPFNHKKIKRWRILMSMDCTYPNTPSTFYSNRRSFKYNANIIQVNTCTWWKPKIEEYEFHEVFVTFDLLLYISYKTTFKKKIFKAISGQIFTRRQNDLIYLAPRRLMTWYNLATLQTL